MIHVQALQQHRQQLAEQERYKQQLLADRQKRIQQQHEQRQKLEDVSTAHTQTLNTLHSLSIYRSVRSKRAAGNTTCWRKRK